MITFSNDKGPRGGGCAAQSQTRFLNIKVAFLLRLQRETVPAGTERNLQKTLEPHAQPITIQLNKKAVEKNRWHKQDREGGKTSSVKINTHRWETKYL